MSKLLRRFLGDLGLAGSFVRKRRSSLADGLFVLRGWLILLLLACVGLAGWPLEPTLARVLGAAPLVVCGALLRVWCRSHFHHGSNTRQLKSERLVLGGPYRRVRNPLYLGNVLGLGGLVLAFAGPLPALGFGIALVALYRALLPSEEAVLLRAHGEAYRQYREAVPAWLPRPQACTAPAGGPGADWGRGLRRERKRVTGYAVALAAAFACVWIL